MPYLVLAIGLLMSVIGISAVAFGYPIIQIERGWASVIAGSTMLAGGLVTISLGLVFQTMLGLKKALLQGAQNSVPHASARSHDDMDLEPSMRMAAEAPLLTPAVVPVAPPLAAILEPEQPLAETYVGETPHVAHDPVFEAPHLHQAPAHDEHIHADHVHEVPHEPVAHEATALTATQPQGYEFAMPSTSEHDLVPVAAVVPPAAATPPPSDDWLDRAFLDLDHELSGGAKDTRAVPAHEPSLPKDILHQGAVHEPLHEEHPHEGQSHDHHAELADLPEHAADVALAERPAEHPSAVIGRYESEGTSYVMYADGSIEAQSDAGLYRFASMAELKAFIEG